MLFSLAVKLSYSYETTQYVKSFSDLYKQAQALLLSPIFFVSGFQ